MRNKDIAELGIEDRILELFYDRGYTQKQIADQLGVSKTQVGRFLRDHKLKNFNDDKLEIVSVAENFNPLTVISYYFQSVHHAAKEMAFTGIVAEMLRDKIATLISEGGVEALADKENEKLLSQWYSVAQKMSTLVSGAQKHLEGYINLFSQVLDVQREVSYVKVITDILRRDDPELYRKIQRALDTDPEAKRVLEMLSNQDILFYWDAEDGKVVGKVLEG